MVPGLSLSYAPMKLFAVTMIKNEVDILPSFLRHILAFFDGGHLLDHRSSDGSTELLKSFCAQHSQWTYSYLNFPGFFQSDVCKFFLAESFKGDVDAVALLDADEFVLGPRSQFDQSFAATVPSDELGLLRWRNCIPAAFGAPFDIAAPLWISQAQAPLGKVTVTRGFFERVRSNFALFPGNHWISLGDGTRVPMREFGELYHVPARSQHQVTVKAINKILGYLARGVDDRDAGTHNFELVDLAAAERLSDDELASFVNSYGLRAEQRPSIHHAALAAAGLALERPDVTLSDASKMQVDFGASQREDRLLEDMTAILAGWGLDDAGPPFTLANGELTSASAQPRFRGTRAQKELILRRQQVGELQKRSDDLAHELATTRDLLRIRNGELDRESARNRDLREALTQLRATYSWRLTRPLRQLTSLWRRTPDRSSH